MGKTTFWGSENLKISTRTKGVRPQKRTDVFDSDIGQYDTGYMISCTLEYDLIWSLLTNFTFHLRNDDITRDENNNVRLLFNKKCT